MDYAANPTETPFSLKTVPVDTAVTKPTEDMFEVADGTPMAGNSLAPVCPCRSVVVCTLRRTTAHVSTAPAPTAFASPCVSTTDTPAQSAVDERAETEKRLGAVAELAGLGPLFKSSRPGAFPCGFSLAWSSTPPPSYRPPAPRRLSTLPVSHTFPALSRSLSLSLSLPRLESLTEAETEYSVKCTKHIMGEHVVFEFRIINTLNDQVLENVTVALEGGEQEVDADDVLVVPAPKAAYDEPTYAYVAFPVDASIASQTFEARLDFIVKDCDPETGECDEEGYDDNYAVGQEGGAGRGPAGAGCSLSLTLCILPMLFHFLLPSSRRWSSSWQTLCCPLTSQTLRRRGKRWRCVFFFSSSSCFFPPLRPCLEFSITSRSLPDRASTRRRTPLRCPA